MDGLTHPVGDEPSNVYWKRRLAVVAAIVVVALLLWWLIGALTGGSGDPAATPGTTVTTSSTGSPAPTTSAIADPSRPCTDADISVVTTSATSFTGDTLPAFTITITSKAGSACVVDPTTGSKIVIVSGKDTWFDSSTCSGYVVFASDKFVIEPAATHELTGMWNRGRDEKGCLAEPQPANAGSYWVTATVQGIAAAKVQFALA